MVLRLVFSGLGDEVVGSGALRSRLCFVYVCSPEDKGVILAMPYNDAIWLGRACTEYAKRALMVCVSVVILY